MRVTHHQHQAPATGFVDPRTLARLDNLELVARFVVDGFINGLHRSPYLGLSLDFAEHRAYMPGDDIRRIDWRLWARTDRYFVKEFEADTNANFMVLLDVSKSMDYGTKGVTKLDYARFLAASLTYFSSQQRDRVGIVTFDRDLVDYVPPSAKHLNVVLHTIDRVKAERPSALGQALQRAAGTLNRRGILVLISDLYEEADVVFEAVKPLRYKGNDLIVFHILDPAEIEFPFEGASSFQDMESGDRIPVVPETQRARYRELIQNHVAKLSKVFTDNRIDYQLFDTATPLDYALFTYLSNRQRLQRTR
ncbi:MAG: DUF58 domain-containing protein [Gemmatimonadetes bacterium]|nr:DUF58 domain-containing protein [Gemmatimonadota bacterium]